MEQKIEEAREEVICKFKDQSIAYESYQKTDEYLDRKKRQFTRDINILSITHENLKKITNFPAQAILFNISLYCVSSFLFELLYLGLFKISLY